MADFIKILKSNLYNYRWSIDGNAYGESYDVTTQDGFSDPTLEKAGWERVLKVNGSLFYTYDSKNYACGLEKAFGVNHQDTSMTAVSDYNSCMAITCLEDGSLIFDTQANIINNYLSSAYGAITGLGLLLNGKSVDMHSGFNTQWNQVSGRTVIGVDKEGNFLSYSFAGVTGSSGLTGSQVQAKCLELGFYNAIMLDGGGSVFREYYRAYDISTTRKVKNALLLYRKRKTNLFIPRTSKTVPSNMQYTNAITTWNRWWYENTLNAGATASLCLPNCTTYAIGRSSEIANKSCRDNEILNRAGFPNASGWFSVAKWATGQTPKVGAIACWTDNGNDWGGHVAVVEATDGTNENTYLSMSGYQTASSGTRSFTNPGKDASWYFQCLDFKTTNYYYTTYDNRGGSFLGYIYNPYVGTATSITKGVSRDTTKNQIKLNNNITINVRTDPSTQSQTLGTISTSDSYYNVLSISTDDNYTWYQIGENNYVADDGSWVTYYDASSTVTRYTITTKVSPDNAGTVTGGGTFDKGTTCTLTANPNTNYEFVSWSDGNKSNPHAITVTKDLTITANFNYVAPIIKYNVASNALPSDASNAGCYVSGTGTYTEGDTVTLTAVPQGDYKFVSWSNGITDNPYTFVINSDTTIDCNFKEYEKYYLTNDKVHGNGHLEGKFSTDKSYSKDFLWYPEKDGNKTIYIKPVPDANVFFKGWKEDGSDLESYKVFPGSTASNLSPDAWFATKVSPTTWKFNKTGVNQKWITQWSIKVTGRKLGSSTYEGIPIKVSMGDKSWSLSSGELSWESYTEAGFEISGDDTIKVVCAAESGSYTSLKLEEFTLRYHYYTEESGTSEKYLCTRYFDGENWTSWEEKEA